jgi:hypothetical protein
VVSLHELVNSVQAASVTSSVLGLIGAVLTLSGLRWDRNISSRQYEHTILSDRMSEFYHHRPRPTEWNFYALVPGLKLDGTLKKRHLRLLARSRRAGELDDSRYGRGCEFATGWVKSVGAMAHELCRTDHVPLRRFLQTYHLTVIREGSIAFPFIVCMARDGKLDSTLMDHAACGLALMELAASYNSIARQQRTPVYFDVKGMPPVGPVVRAPHRRNRLFRNVQDLVFRKLRLREWRVRAVRRRLDRLVADLDASAALPSPVRP